MAWRNDTTYDTVEEAKYELAMALRNVGLRRKAKYILSPIGNIKYSQFSLNNNISLVLRPLHLQ